MLSCLTDTGILPLSYGTPVKVQTGRAIRTHVELSDEASDVVVLEVVRKNLLGEATLIKDVEAVATLQPRHIQLEPFTFYYHDMLATLLNGCALLDHRQVDVLISTSSVVVTRQGQNVARHTHRMSGNN